MLVYAVEATVDLNAGQSALLNITPTTVVYLENNHIRIHVILWMVVYARTAKGGVETERTGAGA